MRMNHVNLTVPDVSQTRQFFETYFGLRCVVTKGRDALAVLVDETGFVLTLNNFEKATEVEYPGAFHIGFMQESRECVDEIYHHLKADGFEMKPPKEFHGAWTFYLQAPGGFLVEVGHQHQGELGQYLSSASRQGGEGFGSSSADISTLGPAK